MRACIRRDQNKRRFTDEGSPPQCQNVIYAPALTHRITVFSRVDKVHCHPQRGLYLYIIVLLLVNPHFILTLFL